MFTHERLQRLLLAGAIAASPLVLGAWFATCPQYGNPACPDNEHPLAVFAAFRAADPHVLSGFLWLTVIAPYVVPIGYLGLGLVALPRAPWWSSLGMLCGWVGSIPWGFIADSVFHLNTAAQLRQDASFSLLYSRQGLFAPGPIVVVAAGWVLGHLLAHVFLGIALLRAKAIPRWAPSLVIAAAPVIGPIAYGTGIGAFQVLGYVMTFVGSLPAAVVMAKSGGKVPQS
jgi:hypothetical protein